MLWNPLPTLVHPLGKLPLLKTRRYLGFRPKQSMWWLTSKPPCYLTPLSRQHSHCEVGQGHHSDMLNYCASLVYRISHYLCLCFFYSWQHSDLRRRNCRCWLRNPPIAICTKFWETFPHAKQGENFIAPDYVSSLVKYFKSELVCNNSELAYCLLYNVEQKWS
jgi:hypothetical protein